jgi:predicted deacylase
MMHAKRGLNHGAYHGETIDIQAVLREIESVAVSRGWALEGMRDEAPRLIALKRLRPQAARRLYLSTGLHGDEPAGPLAVLELLRQDAWPADASLWLCPCLNPTGFPLNRRENVQGVDLNRDYLDSKTAEIQAHTGWLKQQPPFDLGIGLHEDWESHGFYLYETSHGTQPSRAEKAITAVSAVCPIDESPEIEGRPARHGVIRPDLDPRLRPRWPEAFYLHCQQVPLVYTLEAPSDFDLPVRVQALAAAVRAIFA